MKRGTSYFFSTDRGRRELCLALHHQNLIGHCKEAENSMTVLLGSKKYRL